MGVALWEALLANPATPASLIDELYAMELQRIVLNMQISLTHSIARQAQVRQQGRAGRSGLPAPCPRAYRAVPSTTKESP
jgi:Protein of unknown function (DUF3158).